MARFVKCPHCGKSVNFFRRIEKCSVTEELVCTDCIVSSRFSKTVADQIPPEFREKFRVWNIIPFVVLTVIAHYLLASAWPQFAGWDTQNLVEIPGSLINVVLQWIIAIIIGAISFKLPHLGTWMFYFWIKKPANMQKVQDAMKEYKDGRYESNDSIYRFKLRLIEGIQEIFIVKNILFYLTICGNLYILVVFFVFQTNEALYGTMFSEITGWILIISWILNFISIGFAAGFYSNKSPENRPKRLAIEGLSWGYVLSLPIMLLAFILGWVAKMDLADEVQFLTVPQFFGTHQVLFVINILLIIGLALFLIKSEPQFDWKSTRALIVPREDTSLTQIYRFLKYFVISILLLILIIIYILSLELLMVDFAMVFCVTSYYLALIYFAVIFALLKLITRKENNWFKYKNIYWTVVKLGMLIMVINFLPTISTNVYTNPSLDRQFNEKFGNDWQTRITPEDAALLRSTKYSPFEQYFGMSFPINAEYNVVYMQSSPKYVRDGATGEILSNGTSQFTNITHDMVFDAYLPATEHFNVTFGDESEEKFPVIMFMHGIGMERGSGNANWTSQYLANLGYLVVDMSYGFTGWANYPYTGGRERGYDYPQTIHHLGEFTKFLEANADYFHADLSNVYIAGRSFGGWMAMSVGWLYNTSWVGGNFSDAMTVRGVIPYYPATDIPGLGSDIMEIGTSEILGVLDNPYIPGSSNPEDEDFNPEWLWYDALWQAENTPANQLAPVFAIQGMHDYMVPQGATLRLQEACDANGHLMISAIYPFGSHGFDALHWSHYGQSILYYMSRFMAITRA